MSKGGRATVEVVGEPFLERVRGYYRRFIRHLDTPVPSDAERPSLATAKSSSVSSGTP